MTAPARLNKVTESPSPGQCEAVLLGETLFCDIAGALYWPAESLLVVSDLHLEKGAAFAARGSLVPPYDTAATLGALAARIAWWKPARVIALGDSFHNGEVSGRMAEVFRTRLSAMMSGREWIWIAGNHDPDPPKSIGGDCADELAIGSLTFRHAPAPRFAVGEISGHLHPHARIVRRGKSVRRRCFAADGNRMVMPAFGAYAGGLNVRDRPFDGLFEESELRAHVIGRDRLYTIAGKDLI